MCYLCGELTEDFGILRYALHDVGIAVWATALVCRDGARLYICVDRIICNESMIDLNVWREMFAFCCASLRRFLSFADVWGDGRSDDDDDLNNAGIFLLG